MAWGASLPELTHTAMTHAGLISHFVLKKWKEIQTTGSPQRAGTNAEEHVTRSLRPWADAAG